MGLNPTGQLHAFHREAGVPKYITDVATTLTIYEQVVRLIVSTAFAVTLPPVVQAAGLIFTFFVESRSAGACTLQDQDDSRDWQGDYTLDAANDSLVLYSDGIKWHALNNEIA